MQTSVQTKSFTKETAAQTSLEYIKQNYPRLYLALVHHRTTGDLPMTFHDRPWLMSIYKDNAKLLVFMKCVQIGITEFCICDMFHLAQKGKRGMYLLPDDSWVGQWVSDRIDGVIGRSAYYKSLVGRVNKETDSRRLKSICGMTWKFAGTHSKTAQKKPKAAFEFVANCLVIDEYDEHDQNDLQIFKDRLAADKSPYVRLLGNPTIDGQGIAAEFAKTDAKQWFVPCHCGHEQVLEWTDHFIQELATGIWEVRDKERAKDGGDIRPVCTECREPFDRLAKGRWQGTNPDGVGSGYRISHLFISVKPTDMRDLFVLWQEAQGNQTALQNIHNQWLGKTYTNKDESITEELLHKCAGPYIWIKKDQANWDRLIAGIDEGKDFHISISEVINGVRHKRFIGKCRTQDQLDSILDTYSVAYAVRDAQGGSWAAVRDWVKTKSGRFMCYYRPKDQVKKLYDPDRKSGVINTNRTEIIDTNIQAYRTAKVVVPSDWATLCDGEFAKHMTTPQRILDPTGKPIWTKGNDHLFHADVYEFLALLVSGMHNSKSEPYSWRR